MDLTLSVTTPMDPSHAAAGMDTSYGVKEMDALILMSVVILHGTVRSSFTVDQTPIVST